MRKQLLSVFLPLLMMGITAAETQSAGAEATTHAALQNVNVVRGDDGISVEITARGAVAPKLATLNSPDRVIVDLPNTVTATSQNHIVVDRDGVKDIRIGMDGKSSPTTRVVIDLVHACRYELLPVGGKMILKLHACGSELKADSKAAVVAGSVDHSAPAPTNPMAATHNVTEPVAQSTLQAPIADAPSAPSAPSALLRPVAAQSFVVVEPAFHPKAASEEAPKEIIEPSGRVVEAAARFVDRPDVNLLPRPSSAMAPQAQAGANKLPEPAVNLAAEQKSQEKQGASAIGVKYTGEPISVNLKDVDLKDFFRLIHEISGLNIVLDPNVKGSLTIVLDDVPWDQALDIVLKNNDLARQLDGNVLRIATVETMRKEAEARRAEKEAEALAVDKVSVTRFLGYAHSKDVLPLVKKFLSSRGDVVSDDRTNALIISDIPAVMPNLDRLLTQLDRKTQEVEIEARVVYATRNFSRSLGAQTAFEWFNGTSTFGGDGNVGKSVVSQGGTSSSGSGATSGTAIPIFGNFGVGTPTSGLSFSSITKNYALDLKIEAAEKRGLAKLLSRPRVVTQNNIQAVVKQGQRIPIVTQAQLGGPSTVTYVEAVLRLTVVPQITAENTIFLNVDVENTTPDFSNAQNGNPVLNTQQATTQVLVADGGTVVVGGVMQTNNSVNVSQIPVLGNIPYLGNLFKLKSVSTTTNELLFFITPRIIQD